MFKNFKSMNLKNKLLVLLVVFMLIYTSILVYNQSIIGVNYWDIFVYLQNAMLFAHMNIGSQLSVPPILSLIVSIPFTLGLVSELTLFIVSGIFFIFLIIGIYLLFNVRYDERLAFLGSLFFSMLSLVVTWAVSGSNDLPSLTFAVWSLLFTIYMIEYSRFNYIYLAFMCFVCAFFTRFTEGFVLLIILGYLIMNRDKFIKICTKVKLRNFIVFVCIIGSVICAVYLIKQGTIPFISQFLEVSKSSQVSSVNIGYELNPYYYLENIPQLLTTLNSSLTYDITLTSVFNKPTILSYIILALSGIGIVLMFYPLCKNVSKYSKSDKIVLLICMILFVLLIITYTHITYLVSELIFLVAVLLLYEKLPYKFKQLDILMLLWMGVFILMHSYHPVKVDRYIVATFIPIIYFMIKTITKIPHKNIKTPTIILLILLIILLPINASYMASLTHPNEHTTDEKNTANWLKEYDPNYMNENLASDRGVAFSWYLKKYTYTSIPRVLEANNQTINEALESINATYYIDSTSNLTDIKGYHIIYNSNNTQQEIKIYQKN